MFKHLSCIALAALFTVPALAGDGTWTNVLTGAWSDALNWRDGIVAEGLDSTASFTEVDLTNSLIVRLDTPVTIGSLVFADANLATPNWWDLMNNGVEANTLSVTNVFVNPITGRGAAIYAVLAGDTPLTKDGQGTLVLVNTNTYSGATTVRAGALEIGNGGGFARLGSGPVTVAAGATLRYNVGVGVAVAPPTGANLSGDGHLTATAGRVELNGDTMIGGALSYTQNSVAGLYNGIDINTNTTLTASSITLSGDIGQHNTALWDLALDTSATGGPISLNVSLGRNGIWYPFRSFSANAGTGTITFTGSRIGTANAGFRQVPTLLSGKVNIPVNVWGDTTVTLNAVTNSTVSGALSGPMTLVKKGPGTLTLSGSSTHTGQTIIEEGTVDVRQPITAQAARWFDASALGLANGAAVTQWQDQSPNQAHATVPSGNAAPTYIADAGTGTGLGALDFRRNSGAANSSAFKFTRDTAIRSVLSVFKGSSFLLTDTAGTYHFHRPTDDNPATPIWHSTWTAAPILTGQTYINGTLTNGLTAAMPTHLHNGYNLVEVITTNGSVTADSFNKDRNNIHAGDQSHAETLIYDTVLTEAQRLEAEAYLMRKWFGLGEGAGEVLSPSSEVVLRKGATLDLSRIQRQTLGALTSIGQGGNAVRLGDTRLTVANTGFSVFDGAITGAQGSFVKRGSGTLVLAGACTYGGATVVSGGVLRVGAVASPTNPVPGAARWFDASALALNHGAPVTLWNDLSGNSAHAANSTGTRVPDYVTNAVNGLGAVHFNRPGGNDSGSYLRFTRDSNIRTVFSVFKGASFLLTDDNAYHFHRPDNTNPASPLWNPDASPDIRNGQTYVNGAPVNGTTFPMPTAANNGFNLVSLVTTGNVQANTFNKDRIYHCGDQHHGELILYDRVLTDTERAAVEQYLLAKWFGYGFNGTLPPQTPVITGGDGTLDLTQLETVALGSLASVDGQRSRVVLSAATALTVGGNGTSTTFEGSVVGGGSVVKTGAGTLTLAGTNACACALTVEAGTLALAAAVTAPALTLTLDGGTLAVADTAETAIGTLTLASSSALNLGDGSGALAFADSRALTWNGTLTLDGTLGAQSVRFGNSRDALTRSQLDRIQQGNKRFALNADGYLYPIMGTLIKIR